MATFYPSIGSWYQELATGQLFEVVAFDDKSNTIEIQYEDGDLAEYDMESWQHLDITMAAEPNQGVNNAGGMGLGDSESEFDSYYLMNQLDSLEGESFSGFDEF